MAHTGDRNKVKSFVAKNNTTFKLKHVKVFVELSVIQVMACRNGNICIEGRRICYLIPVCVSQSEITRSMCICLLQDHTESSKYYAWQQMAVACVLGWPACRLTRRQTAAAPKHSLCFSVTVIPVIL